MREKSILLIIGGGIAAYKALELIRLLKKAGARVRVILTRAGAEFVTPLSAATLSGEKVFFELFDLTDELEIGHIRLAREADLIVAAPATADLMAKMAQGLAGDLATTCLLAADGPVLLAPAMNPVMWQAPAMRRNRAQLLEDGVMFVGPASGDMACGESGEGRMAEPAEIFKAIEAQLTKAAGPLAGRHVLVTAGPTFEPIDPVRYIANRSSGKQGYAIAGAFAALGARVTLVSGPTGLPEPGGVETIQVESAREMLRAVEQALPADAAIFAAAVADWRVEADVRQKIKKGEGGPPLLKLAENPDILHTISRLKKQRPDLVIGFAAETENVLENARAKRLRKGCDWMLANDVAPGSGAFGGEDNKVWLITDTDEESWPAMAKDEVAAQLAGRVAAALSAESEGGARREKRDG